jgi:hypothetical protein
MNDEEKFLVWSNEHRAWWRPNSAGYTTNLADAGHYNREDAIKICAHSRDGWHSRVIPSEIPVRLDDVQEAAARDIAALEGVIKKGR